MLKHHGLELKILCRVLIADSLNIQWSVVQLYQRPSLHSNECIYPRLLPIICFIVIIYHVAEENDANLVNHGLLFYCVPALKMVDSCPKL